MMMKPRFFVFCYRGDAKLLPGRIENIRWVFPGAPIHLIDDKENPISPKCARELQEMGVLYEQSDFPRYGNLNGPGCIIGMLDVYAKHLKTDEVLIKTDADSLFVDKDFLQKAVGAGFGFMAAQVADYLFGGYFYLIRADVLSFVRRWLPSPSAILQGAHEDVTIGSLAYACSLMLNYHCQILYDGRLGGRTGGFAYKHEGDERVKYIDRLFKKDGKIWMMTLGNPGIGKDQVLEAQRLMLERARREEESQGNNKKEEDHGNV